MEEESYFFKLSKFADALIKHNEENPTFIQPNSQRDFILKRLRDTPLRVRWIACMGCRHTSLIYLGGGRICLFRVRLSNGVFLSPMMTATLCMCGSMRSPTT